MSEALQATAANSSASPEEVGPASYKDVHEWVQQASTKGPVATYHSLPAGSSQLEALHSRVQLQPLTHSVRLKSTGLWRSSKHASSLAAQESPKSYSPLSDSVAGLTAAHKRSQLRSSYAAALDVGQATGQFGSDADPSSAQAGSGGWDDIGLGRVLAAQERVRS